MKFNKVLLYWMTFFFVIILVYALPNYILLAEIPRLDRIVDVSDLGANLDLTGYNLTADHITGNGSGITDVPGDGVGYNSSTINQTQFFDSSGFLNLNVSWVSTIWAELTDLFNLNLSIKKWVSDYNYNKSTIDANKYNTTETDVHIGSNITATNASINARFSNTTNFTIVKLANDSCSAFTKLANDSMRLYGDKTFVNITGDTMTGNLDVFANISASEYLKGQPLDGVLGSGIIWCNEVNVNGNVNATHITGLNVSYPNCIVRLVTTSNAVTYCNISEANVTVTDNQHSVYYVDATCAVQSVTMAVYLATDLSPGGLTDIFNVYATDGEVEVVKGITVKNKETIQKRKEHFYTDHLRIESGMDLTTGPFPELNAGNGYYFYIRTRVNAVAINSTSDGMHIVYHNGTSTGWIHYNQTGINLTNCDNGSTTITCASNKLRRYVFYTIGFDSGTELHQLMPLTTDTTYNFLADCLNIESNPIAYTLPSQDNYVAVVHHIYCGFRDASSWTDGFIDIREGVVGGGAIPDTSIFLTKDMARSPEGNWDLNGYTFYNGVFNGTWNNSVNYYTIALVDLNFTTHESFKHANATYCDGSSSLDGQEAGFYLDNKNCSVADTCPPIYYYGGLSMENVTNLITSRQCSETDKVKNITVNSSGVYILCDTDNTAGAGAGYNSTTINLSIFADNDGVLSMNDSWVISNATHSDTCSAYTETDPNAVLKDGSVALTADWSAGLFTISALGFNGTWNNSVNYYTFGQVDINFTTHQSFKHSNATYSDDAALLDGHLAVTYNDTVDISLANDSCIAYIDSANISVKDFTDTQIVNVTTNRDDNFTTHQSFKHANVTYADDCALLDGVAAGDYLDDTDTTYTNDSFDLSQIPNTGDVDIGEYNLSASNMTVINLIQIGGLIINSTEPCIYYPGGGKGCFG